MKNGNLYQQVKTAKKEEKVAFVKANKIELAMKKELEEAEKTIQEKYGAILETLENEAGEKYSKVLHVAGIYHDYARFFVGDITDVFAVFMSYIEGEKYISYRNYENHEITEGSIIIKEEVNKQYDKIDYDILNKLYNNGDLIRLDSGFSNMVDLYNYVGDPNYSFGEFNYLKEFVNRLIQYRIDNNKRNNITAEELYSFMCDFISTHPDLAMKNKDKREQMLMGQNEEETLISQCKKIEKKLK